METRQPWLSVVISSRNEGPYLERTLTGAFELAPPLGGIEFSVLDDASTDGSSCFCDHAPWLDRRAKGQLRLQRVPRRVGVSQGRRLASLGCRGEVLVFLDAHLDFPQPDLWLQLQRRFEDSRCDLLAIDCFDSRSGQGTVGSVYTSRRLCHQHPAWVTVQDKPLVGIEVPFVNGGFFAIRRRVYQRLEGFPDFLEDWGHEDRFLSMWAWLAGHRCWLDQDLAVGHLYKDVFAPPPEGSPPPACCDPIPSGGLELPPLAYRCEERDRQRIPPMLMNSLRCATLLYGADVFAQCCEQLAFDYGHEVLSEALRLLDRERPQLEALLHRIGLNPDQRDQRMRDYFQRFRPVLPMLDEADLHACAAIEDPSLALQCLQRLPLALASLPQPESDQYISARRYREAACAYALGDFEAAAHRLLDQLTVHPDHLPAIMMLVNSLRALGRVAGARFWLEAGAAIVDRHRSHHGVGPIGPWHPACHQPYLRHLYWPAVDREIWSALAELAEERGDPNEAIRWLEALLDQQPDDPPLRRRLDALRAL